MPVCSQASRCQHMARALAGPWAAQLVCDGACHLRQQFDSCTAAKGKTKSADQKCRMEEPSAAREDGQLKCMPPLTAVACSLDQPTLPNGSADPVAKLFVAWGLTLIVLTPMRSVGRPWRSMRCSTARADAHMGMALVKQQWVARCSCCSYPCRRLCTCLKQRMTAS